MPIIKQNDIIDVIYDKICGYEPEEAYKILELYQAKRLIPVEWIEKKLNCCDNINAEIFVKSLIRDWEKEK